MIMELDRGAFGRVLKATRKSAEGHAYNQEFFALKFVSRRRQENVELKVFCAAAGQPYLLQFVSFIETEIEWIYVMEYVPGGNMRALFRTTRQFSEERVKSYAAELTLAVEYLHKHGIIHRDIKPENILLDEDGHCKLGDFGLAAVEIFEGKKVKGVCGTRPYMAPEVFHGFYGPEVDWWALGVIMYEMMVGKLPFVGRHEVCRKHVQFPLNLSSNAVSILQGFLIKDPKGRLGAHGNTGAIRGHPFFESIDWTAVEEKRMELPPPSWTKELQTIDPEESGKSDTSGGYPSFKTAEEGPQQDEVVQPQIKFPALDPAENGDDDSGRYLSFKTAEEGPPQEEDVQPSSTD